LDGGNSDLIGLAAAVYLRLPTSKRSYYHARAAQLRS
jgi:hypothetical protein